VRIGGGLDRRRQIRFELRAPALFWWNDRDGIVLKGQGFTRDISSHGVYCYAESLPPTDIDIHIDILFSSFLEGQHPLQLSAKARVTRTERRASDDRLGGFVAVSKMFELVDPTRDLPK
jgi:hypothetical protein